MANGFIYFIGDDQGRVKIGWAKNVARRLNTLQVGNGDQLALLAAIVGTVEEEKRLHGMFFEERGEWFPMVEGLCLLLFDLGADVEEPSRKGRWKDYARREYAWVIERRDSARRREASLSRRALKLLD